MIPLTLTLKTVYGKPRYYPACEPSKAVTSLIGRKTLNKSEVLLLQAGGFTITVQPEPASHV